MGVESSKVFYINMDDKPHWDDSKDFWGQTREAQQFILEEAKKIRKGVVINGVKIHPWLYWHLNFWSMMVDKKNEDGSTTVLAERARLRDNEWLLQHFLTISEESKKGLMVMGARRLGKSAFISSYVAHRASTIFAGELMINSITGGSQKDLNQICRYIDFGLERIHPFFKMDKVGKDYTFGVRLGTRNVDNSTDIFSTIQTFNLNKGATSSSQDVAGSTPVTSVWDEALWEEELVLSEFDKFVPIKEVEAGDFVYNANGRLSKVIEKVDAGIKRLYTLKLSNGIKIDACGDHLWEVYINRDIDSVEVLRTSELMNILKTGSSIFIKRTKPIEFKDKDTYYPPKDFGKMIVDKDKNPFLFGSRYIPDEYLFNSVNKRWSLLQGILNSPKTRTDVSGYYIPNLGDDLIKDIKNLLESLGKPSYKIRETGELYVSHIDLVEEVSFVRINSIKPSKEARAYCLKLNSSDGLFITTGYTVTHNCGKFNFLKAFNSFKYSIATEFGWRTSPLLMGCVCAGTKVFRADGSECNIEDITKETGILGYNGDSMSIENIPYIQSPREKECYRIETNNNYIECSYDHPLLVLGEDNSCYFKKAKDISKDDYLLTFSKGGNTFKFDNRLEGKGKYFIGKDCNNLLKDRVISTRFIGNRPIYNLTAGVTNTYITNGFVSHNTGAIAEYSRDAKKVINNPDFYNMVTMDWSMIGEDGMEKPWVERTWGIFMPAQMSLDSGVPKKKIPLSKFLHKRSPDFEELMIDVTQWKESTEKILQRRAELKLGDMDTYNDEVVHMPLDPDDVFLDQGSNPFPVAEANRVLAEIRENNPVRIVDIISVGDNKSEFVESSKPIANFPFAGGIMDCGIKLFEEPTEDSLFDFTYVAGLDHYKHVESTGDSLGALYIVKRMIGINDQYSDSIVCSFVSRPPSMTTFNRTCELLLEKYGAQCLQENADISFQQYLEAKGKEYKLLANGREVLNRMISPNSKQVNEFGLTPTQKNKEFLLKTVIAYCWEEIDSYKDDEGQQISTLGVTRIKDEQLLEEIISFKPGKNVDRIVAFGHALIWAKYLDDINVLPRRKNTSLGGNKTVDKVKYQEDRFFREMRVRNKYGNRVRGVRRKF